MVVEVTTGLRERLNDCGQRLKVCGCGRGQWSRLLWLFLRQSRWLEDLCFISTCYVYIDARKSA